MPKIILKAGSPEFAEPKRECAAQACAMPGCSGEAHFKAPKHRGLNEYYHFCLDHVKEYNKAWDFFSGMSDKEIEGHMLSSLYGDRPTWRYDAEAGFEDRLRQSVWREYGFENRQTRAGSNTQEDDHNSSAPAAGSPEFEALAIMGLEPPVTLGCIKKRYKDLVKKHHPDLNRGCAKSEELLKRINMSYTILKLAYEAFEKLPERE